MSVDFGERTRLGVWRRRPDPDPITATASGYPRPAGGADVRARHERLRRSAHRSQPVLDRRHFDSPSGCHDCHRELCSRKTQARTTTTATSRITNSCAPACAPVSPRLMAIALYDPQRFQLGPRDQRLDATRCGLPDQRAMYPGHQHHWVLRPPNRSWRRLRPSRSFPDDTQARRCRLRRRSWTTGHGL